METRLLETDLDLTRINDEKLAQILEKKRRLAKIAEIQKSEESSTSKAWYLGVWSYCAAPLMSVWQIIGPILSYLTPGAMILSWMHSLNSLKRLFEKRERTVSDYANAFFSVSASVAVTSLFFIGLKTTFLLLGTAIIAPALPYIAIGVFAAFAAHGIFNFAKNIYRAIKTNDKEERAEHLKQAGKALLGIVVNTLALVVTVFFGIKMPDAIQKINDALSRWDFTEAARWGEACVEYAKKGAQVFIALTSFVAAGLVAETVKTNKETASAIWNAIRHPINTLTQMSYAIKANPLRLVKEILLAPVTIPLRLATLVIAGPIQLLVTAAFAGIKKLFGRSSQVAVEEIREVAKSTETLSDIQELKASADTKALMSRLQDKVKKSDKEFPEIERAPKDQQAKRFHNSEMLRFMQKKAGAKVESCYDSIAEIERESLKIGNVYGSLFGRSVTKQLTQEAEVHVKRMAAAAA